MLVLGYVLGAVIFVALWVVLLLNLTPEPCRVCQEGRYRKALMDFSPVFVDRCDECGAYRHDDRYPG